MKTFTQNYKKVAITLSFFFVTFLNYSQTQTYTTPGGAGSFVPPAGVTTVTAEAWGAGGRGGSRTSTYVTGGGGGGAYAKKNSVTVVPGTSYPVYVGAGSAANNTDGEASYFISSFVCAADGGASASNNSTSGASGGTIANSTGDVRRSGGNGANGTPNNTNGYSGGGGSSAGPNANGTNGGNSNGGNAPAGGGDGGNAAFVSNGTGSDGQFPGGGGGGAFRQSGGTRYGGDGANGQVIISYTCPSYAISFAPNLASPVCANSPATVLLRSNVMPSGTFTVTYNLTGATIATGLTATMTFTAGSPGTGTFTTPNINSGPNTVTVTSITSSYCSTNILTNNSVAFNTLTPPSANAGTAVTSCYTTGAINVTAGASATSYSSVLWTSSGSGSFTNANSLSTCTYLPSAADLSAGSVTLTLTALGNAPCSNASSNKTLTIRQAPVALAGTPVSSCGAAVNVTAGSTVSNAASVMWSSSGTGTFANATSMTTCTYTPSAADISAGNVTITLTANAQSPCVGNATDTKILTITPAPSSNAGTAVVTCSTSGAVNITAGSYASNYNTIAWTSSGSGSFANANSLTTCTYNPSAADIAAGSVVLTLTAMSPGCANGTATKTLTIRAAATAVAGPQSIPARPPEP